MRPASIPPPMAAMGPAGARWAAMYPDASPVMRSAASPRVTASSMSGRSPKIGTMPTTQR